MDQQNHSIIASIKTCPRDGCQMKLAKSGSTFVWKCTCCDYTEPLTNVRTERHSFTWLNSLNELKISWPGVPKVTQFLSIEECYQLRALLTEVCR